MKKYYKFIEHNDWEGEIWSFFLELNDREKAILEAASNIQAFTLRKETYTEEEVDELCRDSDSGYMDYFNKVTKFNLPKKLPKKIDEEFLTELLYKGSAFECHRY